MSAVEDSADPVANDGADAENAAVDETAQDQELSKSALRDNISRKGKNSYYYAHSHKATGPKWDGKIEPRLLGTSSSNVSSASGAGVSGSGSISAAPSGKAALMAMSNITNYAFLNEAAKVKIYVNLPGVGNCADEDISLEFTRQSLCLTIKGYVAPGQKAEVPEGLVADTSPGEDEGAKEGEKRGEDKCLSFAKLHGEIDKATYKKKPDKIIVTMTKRDFRTWKAVVA